MQLKKRMRYLLSIAQATEPTTTPVQSVSVAPPVDVVAMFPYAEKLWGNYNKIIFQNIVSMLNKILHITSGGKINFMTLKSNNFDFGGLTTTNASEKAVLNFARLLYEQCFANARLNPNVTELSSEDKKEKVAALLSNTSNIERIYGKDFKMLDVINEIRKLQTTSTATKPMA